MISVTAETTSGSDAHRNERLPLTWFDLLAGIVAPIIFFGVDFLLDSEITRRAPLGLLSFATLGIACLLLSGKLPLAKPARDLILGAIIGTSLGLSIIAFLLFALAFVFAVMGFTVVFRDTQFISITIGLIWLGLAALGLAPILTAFVYIRRVAVLVAAHRRPSWPLTALAAGTILVMPTLIQMWEFHWIQTQLEKLKSRDVNAQVEALSSLNGYPLWPIWLKFRTPTRLVCFLARQQADEAVQRELRDMLGPAPIRTCDSRPID